LKSAKHQINKYLYRFIYDPTERELCKLESKSIFGKEEKDKLLSSDIKIEPSSSAFIKNRMEIILFSEDFASLIISIKKKNISIEGFKVEYLVFEGDKTQYPKRLEKLKDVGYSIEGNPDYYHPKKTYAIGFWDGKWTFGILTKNKYDWHKHKQKPRSYSNSININLAKALVNIAGKANQELSLLDACCGAGTIMLEACFAGYKMEGCDINWKLCRAARENLAYFNYQAKVFRSDIKDMVNRYDAAIIDLPYNLLSSATEKDIFHIIESSAAIADRLVIVSTSDIANLIGKTGYKILDHCTVNKKGKTSFSRKIWLCEKNRN